MKTKTALIAIATLLVLSGTGQAADLTGTPGDWIRAAATVFFAHELGHAQRGANTPGGITFTGDGSLALNYQINHRPEPSAYNYPGINLQIDQVTKKTVAIIMPADAYIQHEADKNAWKNGIKRTEAAVAGGGWDGQQDVIEQLHGAEKRRALIAGAALKAGYTAYHFADRGNTGDIQRSTSSVPVSLIVSALLISAGSDMYRAVQERTPPWSVGFYSHNRTGAVGLKFSSLW